MDSLKGNVTHLQYEPGPNAINFLMLNSVGYKSIMLINIKMPTIVCILKFISIIINFILIFISIINTTSDNLKASRVVALSIQLKIHCSVELNMRIIS